MKTLFPFLCSMCLLILQSCQTTATDAGYQAIGSFTENAHEDWNWYLRGLGGIFGDTIQKFNLDYEVEKEVDVSTARRLLVEGVERFLSEINHSERTLPFLVEAPFTPQRLKFGLSFINSEGRFVKNNHIAYALLLNGKIYYSISSPIRLEDAHEETYEQALEIVNRERAAVALETLNS